jgi:hypothetical protein
VLVAILATLAGVIIVGVGGGLIKPMQARAEHWLSRAEQEGRVVSEQAGTYTTGRPMADTQVVPTHPASDPTQPLRGSGPAY